MRRAWLVANGTHGVQVVETSTREPLSEPIKGESQIVSHVYAQRFHAARKAFNATIADSDYPQFEDAVVSGIAAIEGFLNEMASDKPVELPALSF